VDHPYWCSRIRSAANYSMWDPQVPEARKKLRVLRYDSRGHGQSSVAPGPYSIRGSFGGDVIALLDALGLDHVHFCGLSMGGMIGMWLGINSPERLKRLVLCNTGARIGTPETWNARIEAVRKNGMKPVASAVVERWFSPAFRQKAPATIANTQKMLEETNPDGYVACCAACSRFRLPRPIKQDSHTRVGDRRCARSGHAARGRTLSRGSDSRCGDILSSTLRTSPISKSKTDSTMKFPCFWHS